MDFTRPETWFAIGMFIVSLLVSVYANQTRRALAWPFQRLRRRAGEIEEARLAAAERINGNAYELGMYVTELLVEFVRKYFRLIMWLTVPAVVVEIKSRSWFKARDILVPLLLGMFVGLIDEASATLRLARKFQKEAAAGLRHP